MMIEGIEKRIVLYGTSISSLYLAYLLKIKNPETHVTIISKEQNQQYFLSSLDALKNTNLLSLIDYKSILENKYTNLKIITKNQKQLNLSTNTMLFDYQKLRKYFLSSCISQNVEFIDDFELISVNNKIIIKKEKEQKELSYFYLIFTEDIKDVFSENFSFKTIDYLSLIVDTKTKNNQFKITLLDTRNKTTMFEQPINEYTTKIIIHSKQKDLEKIFEEAYKEKEYKIISKQRITKQIVDDSIKLKNNILFLGTSANIINHNNVDDIYLSLVNAELVEKQITEKIKHKKDIKNYEKEISFLLKETEVSEKINNFLFSKTIPQIDDLFTKLENANLFENINLSSPRKEIQKLKIKPKAWLLLKDLLF